MIDFVLNKVYFIFLQSRVDERRDNSKYTHPRIVLVGDLLSEFICYLTVEHRKYYFENPLKAIEAGFHFFCGLNICYPIECRYIWIFLERVVFKLKPDDSTDDSYINVLLSYLN